MEFKVKVVAAALLIMSYAPVHAAPTTDMLVGTVTSSNPAIDVGNGAVSGSISYDPDNGFTNNGVLFVPLDLPGSGFELTFPNSPAPTITAADDDFFGFGFPALRIDPGTGEFLGFDFASFGDISAFGLSGLTFQTDFVDTGFFFADPFGFPIGVEGSLSFANQVQVPSPPSLLLLVSGLLGLVCVARRLRVDCE